MIEEIMEEFQQDMQFIFADREEDYLSLSKQVNDDYFTNTEDINRGLRPEPIYPDEFNSFQRRLDGTERKRKGSRVANHNENERMDRGERWHAFPDGKREKSGSRDRRRQSKHESGNW